MVQGKPTQSSTSAWQLPDPSEPAEFAIFNLETDEIEVDLDALGFESLDEVFFYLGIGREMLANLGVANRG